MDITHKSLTLIVLKGHEEKDILKVGKNLNLHPLVIAELSRPTLRPKVENYNAYLYLVLHFPVFDPEERKTHAHEIDFVVTPTTLLLVEYNDIKPLREFYQKIYQDMHFRERQFSSNTGILLHNVISFLYQFVFRQLDHVQANIERVDKGIFTGKEREVVKEISFIRRDILGFLLALRPQRLPLESMHTIGKDFFGKETGPYFDNLLGEYTRIWNLLETFQETVQALNETNQALLSTKTNEIIKLLTVLTVLALPITIISSIL